MTQTKSLSSEETRQGSGASAKRKQMLSLVADHNNRYIHEEVYFYIRLTNPTESKDTAGKSPVTGGASLNVILHDDLQMIEYDPLEGAGISNFYVSEVPHGGTSITWVLAGEPDEEGLDFSEYPQFKIGARISKPDARNAADLRGHRGMPLTSTASLRDADGQLLDQESATIMVRDQSALMQYLPELYYSDEFLGRFLMLFESFWKPIETHIEGSELYYNPSLAPERFLPWLATWIGFTLDQNLPLDRQRLLLNAAFSLYRRRGTRQALIEHLQLFTGGQVRIVEHRAYNIILGRGSRLGAASALGKENKPHTFSAYVSLPLSYLREFYRLKPDQQDDEREIEIMQKSFRRQIENLIDTGKPAHTGYQLTVEYTNE